MSVGTWTTNAAAQAGRYLMDPESTKSYVLLSDYRALEAENARLKELLSDVRLSGVESDLPGIDYVTVQIDRRLWQALQEEQDEN